MILQKYSIITQFKYYVDPSGFASLNMTQSYNLDLQIHLKGPDNVCPELKSCQNVFNSQQNLFKK